MSQDKLWYHMLLGLSSITQCSHTDRYHTRYTLVGLIVMALLAIVINGIDSLQAIGFDGAT